MSLWSAVLGPNGANIHSTAAIQFMVFVRIAEGLASNAALSLKSVSYCWCFCFFLIGHSPLIRGLFVSIKTDQLQSERATCYAALAASLSTSVRRSMFCSFAGPALSLTACAVSASSKTCAQVKCVPSLTGVRPTVSLKLGGQSW